MKRLYNLVYTLYAAIHRDLKDRIVFLDVRGESTRTVAGFLARLSSWPTIHRELNVRRPPLSDPEHARRRVRRERFGNHGVDRQYEFAAFGLRLGHDLARGRQEIALAQRFAHGMSARGQKGIGHAAADDESVDFCEQAAEQVELGRHLGSADDRRERTDRCLQHFRERLELILHGAAGIGRQSVTDALYRCMGAGHHREGVIDEDVAERGELRDETGIVALLARMEAGVL